MFLRFRRKILTFFIVLSLICASLCVTVGVSRRIGGGVFVPRYRAPEYSDGHYYEDNIFYQSGYGIPNCTAYAWGRVYELLGEKPRLCTGDARDWFEYNKNTGEYPYGDEARLGAIACFDNEAGGHVAVVEAIDDGVITLSNSAYRGAEFYLTTAEVDSSNPGQEGWDFQGYIYPAEFESRKITLNSPRRISADVGLNLRAFPSMSAEVLDVLPENTRVYVSELCESEGCFWARTSYGGVSGYCAVEYTESVL